MFSDRIAFDEEVVLEEADEVLAEVFVGVQLSWRRSHGLNIAACCDGLEVSRCGNDQHGCDMADLMTDSFRRTKMTQLNHRDLSHKYACTFVRACEQTVCTSCTLWVCVLCTFLEPFMRSAGQWMTRTDTTLDQD